MTVSSDGSAYAFEQVDRDASRGTINVVPAFQEAVNRVANRPMGGKVTFGTYGYNKNSYPFQGTVTVPSQVQVEGIGDPVLDVTGGTQRMFQTDTQAENVEFRDFTCEGNGNVNVAMIEYADGFRNGIVERVSFLNEGAETATNDSVRAEQGFGLTVRDTYHERQFRGLHLRGAAVSVLFERAVGRDHQENASFIRFSSARQFWMNQLDVGPHLPNVYGNHHIQSAGQISETIPSVDVWLHNSRLEGNPGVAFEREADGTPVANGAVGDIATFRNVQDFDVSGNTFSHGGELGFDAVDGSAHGDIHDNLFHDIDASAIILGSSLNERIRNVAAYNNRIRRIGLDRAGAASGTPFISRHSRSAIRVWNADQCSAWHNDILGNPSQSFGIYIYANGNTGPAGSEWVKQFTHGYNRFFAMPVGSEVFEGFSTATADTADTTWTQGRYEAPVGTAV